MHCSSDKSNITHGSRVKPNITRLTCQTKYYVAYKPNQILHGSRAKPNITWFLCQTKYYMVQVPNQIHGPHAKLNITWFTCQTKYYMAQVPNQIHGPHAKLNITWPKCQTKYLSRLTHIKLILIIGSRTILILHLAHVQNKVFKLFCALLYCKTLFPLSKYVQISGL